MIPTKLTITRGYISEAPQAQPEQPDGDLDQATPDALRMAYQHAMELSDDAMSHSVNLKRNHALYSDNRDFNSLDQGHSEGKEVHGRAQKAFDGIEALAQHHGREHLATSSKMMSKLHSDIAAKHSNLQYHPEIERRSGV